MGLSFYMCAPVYRIDTALPLGLGNIYCRIDALSETERIWQIKKTNRRTNHNPVCLSFSAHSGPLIKRSEVVKVCRATRDCGLRRFLCVACSALIYILVRKVIKVTTVSTYPRGMQMPPTAPRGPHCPPLVPCVVDGCIQSMSGSSAGSTFMMQRYPVNATRRGGSSIMSIATRLGDWSGWGYVGD